MNMGMYVGNPTNWLDPLGLKQLKYTFYQELYDDDLFEDDLLALFALFTIWECDSEGKLSNLKFDQVLNKYKHSEKLSTSFDGSAWWKISGNMIIVQVLFTASWKKSSVTAMLFAAAKGAYHGVRLGMKAGPKAALVGGVAGTAIGLIIGSLKKYEEVAVARATYIISCICSDGGNSVNVKKLNSELKNDGDLYWSNKFNWEFKYAQ